VNVVGLNDPKCAAWIGGSLLVSSNPSLFVTKQEYEENGKTIIHERCHI
jgi:actin-related protein